MDRRDWIIYAAGAMWGAVLIESAYRFGATGAAVMFVAAIALALICPYRSEEKP